MSRVFLAEETSLGRKVVIKVLPADLAAGLNADRFRREIQLAARLQHPHIVPLLSAGAKGGLLYYTMPFISGENLRARIVRLRELPVMDATRILREVADALDYAHEQGVVSSRHQAREHSPLRKPRARHRLRSIEGAEQRDH